jgi:hypothetical protein
MTAVGVAQYLSDVTIAHRLRFKPPEIGVHWPFKIRTSAMTCGY